MDYKALFTAANDVIHAMIRNRLNTHRKAY